MGLELWLIRHGQTDWNAEGRIQGKTNSQLSNLGIEQAKALHKRLKNESFDFYFSSDSDRAHNTGKIAFPEIEFVLDERLREIGFGLIEGKTYAELNEQERDWFDVYKQDPYNRRVPEGESWQEHIARLADWLTDLPKEGRAVAFSHGGSIRAVLFSLIGYPKHYDWNMRFENTGVTRVYLEESKSIIVSTNDAAHLETL